MTPWVLLGLWATMVAALLRTGPTLPRSSPCNANRSAPLKAHSRQVRTRVATSVLAILASAPLVFLLAIRQDVGTDFTSYVDMYTRFRAGEALPWIEPIYATLNRLATPFGPSGVVIVFAVSAACAAFPLFYRVFRSSPTPWLSTVMLFGLSMPFLMTNAVRSAVAIGIIMLVLPAIWRRHLFTWSLGILLAGGFHFTALLVWPLYWVLHLAWPKTLAWSGLVCAMVLSTNQELAVRLVQWAPTILPSKYSHYPARVLEELDAYQFRGGYLIYIILAGLMLAVWDRARNEGQEILVFRNVGMLGLVLAIGLYQFWAINRLSYYFMPALTVVLPWIISRWATAREKLFWTISLATLFGLLFARGLWGSAHDAVPYKWVL